VEIYIGITAICIPYLKSVFEKAHYRLDTQTTSMSRSEHNEQEYDTGSHQRNGLAETAKFQQHQTHSDNEGDVSADNTPHASHLESLHYFQKTENP
jgi:hypothetical protein